MDDAEKIAIVRRYCDVAYLDGEIAKRGVAAVLAEMFAVRSAVRPPWVGLDLASRFEKLRSLIEAEAPALEGWAPESDAAIRDRQMRAEQYPRTVPDAQRGAFLQQLRNRAFERDLEDIQRAAEQRMDELHAPHARERIKTTRGSAALRRTLKEGVYEVNAVLLTADGETAISGSKTKIVETEGRVTVWSLESGQATLSFDAHSNQAVTALAKTPDDRLLITGSSDNTARVWALATGRLVYELTGHRGAVWAVAVSPNGALAVTAGLDATLTVWDLETGYFVRSIRDLPDPVISMVFYPDSRQLVTASMDGRLRIWDVRAGSLSHVLRGPGPGARAVALSRDGSQALSAHTDGSILLWDMERREIQTTMTGHTADVTAVRFTGFERAVSGSRDGTLRLWDLARGVPIGALWGHTSDVTSIDVDPDGRTLVSGAKDGTVREWSLPEAFRSLSLVSPSAPAALAASKAGVVRVATSLNGEWAATALANGRLQVWDLVAGVVTRTLKGYDGYPGFEWVHELRISEDGRALVTAARTERLGCIVTLWAVESAEAYRELTEISYRVGLSGDARWAVGVGQRGGLAAWNMETGEIARHLPLPGQGEDLWNIQVNATGDRAAYMVWHGPVQTLDVMAARRIHEMDTCSLPVAMSGEGNRLIVKRSSYNATDGVIVVDLDWDRGTVTPVRGLVIANQDHMAMTFDGRLLAYKEGSGLLLLDLDSGESVLRVQTEARLTSCAFTPNGRTLVAGDSAGALHILDLHGI